MLAATAIALVAVPLAAATPADFSQQRLRAHVQTLGSDAYEGPRLRRPRAETQTVDYLSDQFRPPGFQPGGDMADGKRGWTQAVPLLKSDIVGAPRLSLNLGNGQSVALTQGEQIAVRAPTNGDKALSISTTRLCVFVGYGVTAPERNWDDFKGLDAQGKILVVLVNDPDFEGGEDNFGGKAMTYYGRWTYKYEEAARRARPACSSSTRPSPPATAGRRSRTRNTNTMFDIVRENPRAEHPPLEGWIQRDLAAQIFAASGTELRSAEGGRQAQGLQAGPAQGDARRPRRTAKTEIIMSHNVVGLLPGTRTPTRR